MRRILVFLCTACSLPAFSQSETNDFIHYDTLIIAGVQKMNLHISRPRNYFTPGHPDTASRRVLVNLQGMGEVSNSIAVIQSNWNTYGFHYWLQNGWDGGITTGSGKHYPILITITWGLTIKSTSPNLWPDNLYVALKYIIDRFHPRGGKLDMCGLSLGAISIGRYISYYPSPGNDHPMSLVNSVVCLQGFGNDLGKGHNLPGDAAWGHWGKKFNGKYFGVDGTRNEMGSYRPRNSIRDSVGLGNFSAYYTNVTLGGGAHCCWNEMYDPRRSNWTNQESYGTPGSHIGFNGTPKPDKRNTIGTYRPGSSIYQWMMLQGDTTLAGASLQKNRRAH